jgi:putative hydrolase of the HAD superfamily
VLCDVDGVLRHWDGAVTLDMERRNGLAPGSLHRAAFAPERLLPAITGKVTDAEWRAAIIVDLVGSGVPARHAAAVVGEWSRSLGRLDEPVCDLLARARLRVPVALVSNGTTRLEDDLDRLGVTARVDPVVVNSARVGMAKPDAGVYLAAAEAVGVTPEHCLFVDDTPGHVDAARALGITGLLYRGGPAGQNDQGALWAALAGVIGSD